MSFNMAFFMDFGILVLLAATVFIGFKLTLSLRNFKESRFEMEGLVNRLSGNIDQAERAVAGMQNTARKTGLELDEIINDAKKLADELRIMNESGNSLADRLEKLAERNSAMISQMDSAGPIQYPELPRGIHPVREEGFSIHDRDFGPEDYDDDFDAPADTGFQSQAERELFEALQSSKARQRGRA